MLPHRTNQPSPQPLKGTDPALLTRSMADIAERSQRLVTEWLNRQSLELPQIDPMNVGHAFMEMTTQLMRDPAKLVQAQIGFWQDYMTLWQNTTRRMFGIENPDARHRSRSEGPPLQKDNAWKENEVFDFIKQDLFAVGPLRSGRRQPCGRTDAENRPEGGFLLSPVRRCDEPKQFPDDQSGSPSQDRRDPGGENPTPRG